jgi:hypothetical protein
MRAAWWFVVTAACHGASGGRGADSNLGGFPAQIALAASTGTIADGFRVDASGSGSGLVGSIAITADAGNVQLAGTQLAAFVYERQPFSPYTLFQGFAVGASAWDVFWLYCQSGLVDAYDEGIAGPPLASYAATGTCADSPSTATSANVQLPALTIATPTPSAGYTVTGVAITVRADGTGTLALAGAQLPTIVFDDVDCTSGCGTPGWYELHSLAWDAAHARAIYFIAYLLESSPSSVELTYARSLPDLADPIGTLTLPATWTANPVAGRRVAGARAFVPPPELAR